MIATCSAASSLQAEPETIKTRIGDPTFTHDLANGYPSIESVQLLFDEMSFQCAWFSYFRFYSPTKAYLDRSWVLPDIKKSSW